ncbi:unnamed protein product [Sphagnum balticum]
MISTRALESRSEKNDHHARVACKPFSTMLLLLLLLLAFAVQSCGCSCHVSSAAQLITVVLLRTKELVTFFIGVIVTCVIAASFAEVQVVDAIHSVPAYFVLGDSTLDVGENNYLPNAYHANFPPYGETFFHRPTGRFSNGRNVGDFIAQALALPFAPPYLQPNATFYKGVKFASGGSGLLNTTNPGLVRFISLANLSWHKQTLHVKICGFFESYIMCSIIIHRPSIELISRSLFLISVGLNDITFGNLTNPTTQKQYNATQYTNLMLEAYKSGIKTLYASGTRKIVLFGEGVDGCEPIVRIQNNSQCVDFFNELALEFEAGLKQLVDEFHVIIPGLHLVLAYQYNIEHDMITNPQSFRLKNATAGCCGAGILNAQYQCGTKVPTNVTGVHQTLCKHPSEYLYWDYIHNTEYVDKVKFQYYWDGNTSFVYPFNLRTLALV